MRVLLPDAGCHFVHPLTLPVQVHSRWSRYFVCLRACTNLQVIPDILYSSSGLDSSRCAVSIFSRKLPSRCLVASARFETHPPQTVSQNEVCETTSKRVHASLGLGFVLNQHQMGRMHESRHDVRGLHALKAATCTGSHPPFQVQPSTPSSQS